MQIRYEIRQQVCSVQRAWLEVIDQPTSERAALNSFRNYCEKNPGTYFEVVRIEMSEACLGHTKNGAPVER